MADGLKVSSCEPLTRHIAYIYIELFSIITYWSFVDYFGNHNTHVHHQINAVMLHLDCNRLPLFVAYLKVH